VEHQRERYLWGHLVAIAEVDCTVEKDVCSKNQIKGYPTLKLFAKGKDPISYDKARTIEALQEFITEKTKKADEPNEEL
jgi:thioredoxin-like negative regulator of GroEL